MTTSPATPNCAGHILVASPNRAIRQRVIASMRSPFRRVEQAAGGAEALDQMERGIWQMLFLDRQLPDLNADELATIVRQRFPTTEVVLLDAESIPERSWLAAADSGEPADRSGESHDERLVSQPTAVDPGLHAPLPGMIGNSRAMQPVYRAARLLARRETTVLITGATGSGKELVARAVHQLSPRAPRNFVVVNCAAIPEQLLESELFGHTRGAFTGASQSYGGRIQAAQGGTLFLDEIGEMPLSLQPKLLRFLERKEVQRLGSSEVLRVDARIIAATNVNLPVLVSQGKFRADLYYRLATFPIELPPLRERPEDLVDLARHFLQQFAPPSPAPELSADATRLLRAYPWNGNVRELQNVMERALILAEEAPVICPEHLMLNDHQFTN
jgi:DNA-binding NtrC family response regulator